MFLSLPKMSDHHENDETGRRISISDSTDDESDYEESRAMSVKEHLMRAMRMRYAMDIAQSVGRSSSSQPGPTLNLPGTSAPSTSTGPFQMDFPPCVDGYRPPGSYAPKPLKKRPTMQPPVRQLEWAENGGVGRTTKVNFTLLKALREANRKLANESIQNSTYSPNSAARNEGDTPLPKIRRLHLQHIISDLEDNNTDLLSSQRETDESINADPAVLTDSLPESAPRKRHRPDTDLDDECDVVDVETNSAKEITITEDAVSETPGTSTEVSKIQETHLNQALLSLLECPVCLECMEPPMAQCRRGHLICNTCRDRMLRCPVCRASFTSVRNRAMEQVAEKLRYPCRHGCSLQVVLRQRVEHEANCQCRLYACPLPACAKPSMPHEDLINHFLDTHPDSVAFGTKGTFRYNRYVNHLDWIMSAHGQVFHVHFLANNRSSGVYGSVTYIGPKNKSSKYTYEMTIVGSERSRKLVYSRETHSDLDSRSDFYAKGDSFFVGFDNALTFGKPSGNTSVLVFKVEIQPIKETVNDSSDAN